MVQCGSSSFLFLNGHLKKTNEKDLPCKKFTCIIVVVLQHQLTLRNGERE